MIRSSGKLFVLFAFSAFLFLKSFAFGVEAVIIKDKNGSILIEKDETIDDDLFIFGESIEIYGIVNGDLYAIGGNITVDGVINGDVIAIGGVVEISGIVQDDARLLGGTLAVKNARIGDSVMLLGGTGSVDKESSIGGGLVFGTGSMQSGADVGRGVTGTAGSITLSGDVAKDIRVSGKAIRLKDPMVIGGNVIYESENTLMRDVSVIVGGSVRTIIPDVQKTQKDIDSALKKSGIGYKIWSYLSALLVGAVLLYFFPKQVQSVAELCRKKTLRSLGWGLIKLIMTIPILILLAITAIGLPLAVILGLIFIIEIYVAKLFVGMAIGTYLTNAFALKKMGMYSSFALGLAVFYLFTMAPVLSIFANLTGLLVGLGAICMYAKGALVKNRIK